ncbi:MAG: VOC family protein [Pseudomonadota bacterium]|nr:VOC family protein [Pseudomonadota bacterium]
MAVLNVTPMLAVADIDAAAKFLIDCLGFDLGVRMEGYAYMRSGNGGIRLIEAEPGCDMDDPARQHIVYIDVDDVDALYAAHQSAIEALPETHFRAPFNQPYNQREFHLIHGPFLFMVGQDLTEVE